MTFPLAICSRPPPPYPTVHRFSVYRKISFFFPPARKPPQRVCAPSIPGDLKIAAPRGLLKLDDPRSRFTERGRPECRARSWGRCRREYRRVCRKCTGPRTFESWPRAFTKKSLDKRRFTTHDQNGSKKVSSVDPPLPIAFF